MNDSQQRKIGAILSYVSIVMNTLVQLVYTPFLINNLGQNEYGLYSLVSSVIGYLTVLDLGFGNAIVVYTAKYRANKDDSKEKKMQGMFKVIFFIIGLFAAVLGLIFSFNVNNLFGKTMTNTELEKVKIMMLILTFNLVITFSFNIYSSIINAYEKFIFQKILSLCNTLLRPIIMIPLLFLGYKSIALCVALTVINMFVVLSNYIYCKRKLDIKVKYLGIDKELFIEMFGYSFFIFLNIIVDKVNWSVDQFILGAVCGAVSVSIYSIASQLNALFINLSTALSSVFLPKMSIMIEKKSSPTDLTDEMIKIGRLQYLVIFFMASCLVVFGKEFIVLWAGSDYESSYYISLCLIIPVCFPLIQNLGISILQAMNKHKFRSIAYVIMAGINVLISYLLAQKYGAIGCAVGTAISLIICNIVIMNIYYKLSIGIDVLKFWKEIINMSLRLFIPLILILMIKNYLLFSGLIGIALYGLMYLLIYSFISYYLILNTYEKNLVHRILKKLHLF